MRDSAVLALGDARSVRPELVGAKAANLALAARAGLKVLPGFVITTDTVGRGFDDPDTVAAVRVALDELGDGPFVVRSSSTIEDAGESSMAGRFTSVLGVAGWAAFLDAARRVAASANAVFDADGTPAALAILVQPMLDARFGGVMFAKDPLSGRTDHLVVEVVAGGPDALVSGRALAARWVLSSRWGRVVERTSAEGVPELDHAVRRSLAHLAAAATRCFGTPQDIEWAVDPAGSVVLLQSRPVTATGDETSIGPLLGPGPVSETFPDQLSELEQWLWLEPLRDGIVRALLASGAVAPRRLRESPVVTAVDGFAVVDLDLFGMTAHHLPVRRRFRPAAIGRRLVSAWRVGRLRVALPSLIDQVIGAVDDHLSAVPPLATLDDGELDALVERARRELATVHCFEVLAGMLLDEHDSGGSAAMAALHALHRSRVAGLSDDEIVLRDPIVLCLAPPTLAHSVRLPAEAHRPTPADDAAVRIGRRDTLRVRTRWLQELLGRAARERAGRRGTSIETVDRRRAPPPVAFRMNRRGDVVAVSPAGSGLIGQPASAGRAVGVVRHRASSMTIDDCTILVTRTLDPALAAVLPGLAGIVTETGSSLSHLAILAREAHVPAVVALDHAVSRLPAGTRVAIDGSSGRVEILESEEALP